MNRSCSQKSRESPLRECWTLDYEYIGKELLRNRVNKKLLWIEYLEDSKRTGDNPLMYSQLCHCIREHEEKRRATMHIPKKPDGQIEDWAGDPAKIIAPDTGELINVWIFVGVMSYSQYTFLYYVLFNTSPAVEPALPEPIVLAFRFEDTINHSKRYPNTGLTS